MLQRVSLLSLHAAGLTIQGQVRADAAALEGLLLPFLVQRARQGTRMTASHLERLVIALARARYGRQSWPKRIKSYVRATLDPEKWATAAALAEAAERSLAACRSFRSSARAREVYSELAAQLPPLASFGDSEVRAAIDRLGRKAIVYRLTSLYPSGIHRRTREAAVESAAAAFRVPSRTMANWLQAHRALTRMRELLCKPAVQALFAREALDAWKAQAASEPAK